MQDRSPIIGYQVHWLTHWDWVMLIYIYIYVCVCVCVRKLTIIYSDNGLLPGQHQAIIRTNAGPLGTKFSEVLIKNCLFHSRKWIWKFYIDIQYDLYVQIQCSAITIKTLVIKTGRKKSKHKQIKNVVQVLREYKVDANFFTKHPLWWMDTTV